MQCTVFFSNVATNSCEGDIARVVPGVFNRRIGCQASVSTLHLANLPASPPRQEVDSTATFFPANTIPMIGSCFCILLTHIFSAACHRRILPSADAVSTWTDRELALEDRIITGASWLMDCASSLRERRSLPWHRCQDPGRWLSLQHCGQPAAPTDLQ